MEVNKMLRKKVVMWDIYECPERGQQKLSGGLFLSFYFIIN